MKPAWAIIPSRFASSRFPGKPLALLLGVPMVEHVARRCLEARCFERVVVATDDSRILNAVARIDGVEAVSTNAALASGTDRVAAAARMLETPDDCIIVNVQGDEPAIPPEALRQLVATLRSRGTEMATLVRALATGEHSNPSIAKVVLNEAGSALYFSRADIPFVRGPDLPHWAHLGVYAYAAPTLQRLAAMPPTALERAESLEQLRALGNGISIVCCVTEHKSPAVDTPGDVVAAEAALRALGVSDSKSRPSC